MHHSSRIAIIGFLATVGATAHAASLYRLDKTISLGDGERWDYLSYDESTSRVYVARGNRVDVVDVAAGKVVGKIDPIDGGTHGVVVAANGKIGYTDDGKGGLAIAFDPKTFQILEKIKTAPDADGIVLDPSSGHLFEIDGDSATVTVIDPLPKKIVATINVGDPLEAGVSSGDGRVFIDGVEKHDIVVIDTKKNAVTHHFPMPGCERPHGIAYDEKAQRVFATCINKVMVVVDANDGRNVATVPIGAGSDGAVFDQKRHRAISSNGEGSLTVVEGEGDNYRVVDTVTTIRSARTIAIDPSSGRLFIVGADVTPESASAARPKYAPGSTKLLVYTPQN